jgi:hypothetical protein
VTLKEYIALCLIRLIDRIRTHLPLISEVRASLRAHHERDGLLNRVSVEGELREGALRADGVCVQEVLKAYMFGIF